MLEAIEKWKNLTDETYKALIEGDAVKVGKLMDKNFDIRRSVMNLSEKNLQMVEVARKTGASAKFTGSGGAIIGTYPDYSSLQELKVRLGEIGVDLIIPEIVKERKEK